MQMRNYSIKCKCNIASVNVDILIKAQQKKPIHYNNLKVVYMLINKYVIPIFGYQYNSVCSSK